MLTTRAHALLGRRGATSERRLLQAKKDFLELDHSRIGEQQRWIVTWYERGARTNDVTGASEIIKKSKTDIGGLHSRKYRRGRERMLATAPIFARALAPAP